MSPGRSHDALSHDGKRGGVHSAPERDRRGPGNALQEAAGNQATAALVYGDAPLTPAARATLERAYGVDLGGVRVHSGAEAAAEAVAKDAAAFTRGQEVYLGTSDPRVIAHELAHTMHQVDAGDGPTLSEGALEAEAEAGGDVTVGGATPGAVQKLGLLDRLFGEDEEEKKRQQQQKDEEAEAAVQHQGVLASPGEWKKYVDDPVIGPWLRAHPGRLGPPGQDKEFDRWVADPKQRPAGAPTGPAPVTPPIRQAVGVPAKTGPTELERQHVARVRSTWSPEQKGAFAEARRQEKWRKYVESMTPEKGSVGEAVQTLGEATGISSIKRAITGKTRLGQKLSWDDRIGEAVLGPAKLVETAGTIALGLPEFGPVGEAAAAPELLGTGEELAGAEELGTVPEEGSLAGEGAAEEKSLDDIAREKGILVEQEKSLEEIAREKGILAEGQGGVEGASSQGGGLETASTGGSGPAQSQTFLAAGGRSSSGAEGLATQTYTPPTVLEAPVSSVPKAPPQTAQLPIDWRGGADWAEKAAWPQEGAGAQMGETFGRPPLTDVPAEAEELSTTKDLSPPVQEEPRHFPGAEPNRPPVVEPDTPPPITDPADEREALLPGARGEQEGPLEAPGADQDKGPVIAAKRDPIETFINSKYLIDMRKHPRPRDLTAEDWPRDSVWFWKEMLKKHPFLFSQSNRDAIKAGTPPIADKQWLKYHKGQTFWEGDELRHHHVDRGPLAAGIPETPHRVYHGPLHYYEPPGSRYSSKRFKKPKKPKKPKKLKVEWR